MCVPGSVEKKIELMNRKEKNVSDYGSRMSRGLKSRGYSKSSRI